MKILSIKKDKWTNKYSIEFENNEQHKISLEQIIKYKLKEDIEVEYNHFKEILNEENEKEAFNKALDMVSIRDHTCFEIKNKLLRKGYSIENIDNVIYKLSEYNFVNDEKYANNYLNYALKYKKHGKNKIIYTLTQKGIPKTILSNLHFDDDKELETAKILCEKKLRTLKEDDKKREKLYRYILSRGYTHATALKVMQNL